jgi:hypothetical protein
MSGINKQFELEMKLVNGPEFANSFRVSDSNGSTESRNRIKRAVIRQM